jgi:hypothetical protein
MTYAQMVRQRSAARLREERMKGMKVRGWSRLKVRGIAPYTIDRVEGRYLVEFDRTGRSLDYGDMRKVPVVAFELRHPDGQTVRYATLREARSVAAVLQAEMRKRGEL